MMKPARYGQGIRAGVRRLFRVPLHTRDRARADADAELDAFLDERIQQLTSRGMTRAEAHREALQRLGGSLDDVRSGMRRSAERRERTMRWRDVAGDISADARFAARLLQRAPGFAAAVIVTVTLTVVAACTVFAVVNPLLLRPLPYPHSDRLVGLWHTMPGLNISIAKQSPGTYAIYRQSAKSLESIGIFVALAATLRYEQPDQAPERARVTFMTPSTFAVLGVRPLLGRLLVDADVAPGAPGVAVISEALWRTRFGANANVITRTIDIDGQPRRIVGVMPAAFAFPRASAPAWVPLDPSYTTYAGGFGWDGIARLRPGFTIADAQRELRDLLPRVPQRFPEIRPGVSTATAFRQTKLAPVVHSMRADVIGSVDRVLWLVATVVGLLVLVALSNITSLLLVRAEGRRRELAVRAALGASMRAAWTSAAGEAILAALVGGVLGLALSVPALEWLVRARPLDLPRLNEVRVDGAVVSVALALTALFASVGILVGALQLRSGDAATILRESSRTGTAGRRSLRLRGALVGLEVALSLVLLASSGVIVRSALRLRSVRPGFDPANVFTFWTFLPDGAYPRSSSAARLYRELLDRIQRLPGVESAAATNKVPLEIEGFPYEVLIWADDGSSPSVLPPVFQATSVTSGYFGTMRIPLISGRSFDDANVHRGAYEAVASRGVVEHFWHDPTGRVGVGKRLRPMADGPWFTIVGVVNDVRDSTLTRPPVSEVYFDEEPVSDSTPAGSVTTGRDMGIVVRTRGTVPGLSRSLEREIHALDPTLPFYRPATMDQIVSDGRAQMTAALALLMGGAAATLLLGIIGLYGVIAYVVSLRTREIGIRIALGLEPGRAPRLVVRQGQAIVVLGAAAGAVAFVEFARLLSSLTFDVSPADGLTLASATATVIAVSMLAIWIPARRASRVDPVEALKTDR